MNDETEDLYPCLGICQTDPDTGYCIGCGRPPEDDAAEATPAEPADPPPAADAKA